MTYKQAKENFVIANVLKAFYVEEYSPRLRRVEASTVPDDATGKIMVDTEGRDVVLCFVLDGVEEWIPYGK